MYRFTGMTVSVKKGVVFAEGEILYSKMASLLLGKN